MKKSNNSVKFPEEILPLDRMRALYFEEGAPVTDQWKKSLRWHLQHGVQWETVNLIGDIALCNDPVLNHLAPDVVELIHQDDDFLGQQIVSCILGYMKLSDYAGFFFELFHSQRGYLFDENVKDHILFKLGYVLNMIRNVDLKYKIAELLLTQVYHPDENMYRSSSYHSILVDMDVPRSERLSVAKTLDPEKDLDWDLVERFKNKYGINV